MRLILIITALLAFQSAAASEFDETKALAEQGVATAQYNLGVMYADGDGVPENGAEAVKWFKPQHWSSSMLRLHTYPLLDLRGLSFLTLLPAILRH